jgi:hypothetical protein
MKHLKPYSIFESEIKLTEEQTDFLNKFTKGKWTLNKGLIDIKEDFVCSYDSLKDFKGLHFGRVIVSFYCNNNQLQSLEGAPQSVGGNFYCGNNQLSSLEGAPHSVGGNFYCYNNQLKSLEGAPSSVGGDFYCDNNSLQSLEGAPASVGGDFVCDEFGTNNWTLEGQLEILETGTPAAKALIATIISPEALQSRIDANPEGAAIELKSVWADLKSRPEYKTLKWPRGLESDINLLNDLDGVGL